MLDTMCDAVPAARSIGTLVNPHSNGDHTFGNQLMAGAEIVTTRACEHEMLDRPPEALAAMVRNHEQLGGQSMTAVRGSLERFRPRLVGWSHRARDRVLRANARILTRPSPPYGIRVLASRVRVRIERVLDWSKVRGYGDGKNPARWRGHLDKVFMDAKRRRSASTNAGHLHISQRERTTVGMCSHTQTKNDVADTAIANNRTALQTWYQSSLSASALILPHANWM